MAFFVSSHRFGILSAIYGIYLEVIIISTYATVFSIPLFNRLPCPEATFLSRKNRNPERRCHMTIVFVKGPGIIRFD
jgi:hypothetical protein